MSGIPKNANCFHVKARTICPRCGDASDVGKGYMRTCNVCNAKIIGHDKRPARLWSIGKQAGLKL